MIRLKNIGTIQTFNKRGLFYNLMLSIYCVFNYKILFNFNSYSFLSRKEEGKKSVKKINDVISNMEREHATCLKLVGR